MEIAEGKPGNETRRNQLVDVVGIKVLDCGQKELSTGDQGQRLGETSTCDFGCRKEPFHSEQLRADYSIALVFESRI